MNIVATGDLHLKEMTPKFRKDNYLETIFNKLRWVFRYASSLEDPIIVLPGDLYDSFKAGDFLKRIMIKFLKEYNIEVLAISGQHDQRYHTGVYETIPLGVLEAAGVIKILNEEPYKVRNVKFHGSSYGEKIPDIFRKRKGEINVLVCHKMISDRDYWHGHVDYSPAQDFLESLPYDLIISGDNHNAFVVHSGNKTLINCGSWTRARIDQIDHIPIIAVYNVETKSTKIVKIPIQSADIVMDFSKMLKEDDKFLREKELKTLIESLKSKTQERKTKHYGFLDRLTTYIEEHEIDNEVSNLIWEAIKKEE